MEKSLFWKNEFNDRSFSIFIIKYTFQLINGITSYVVAPFIPQTLLCPKPFFPCWSLFQKCQGDYLRSPQLKATWPHTMLRELWGDYLLDKEWFTDLQIQKELLQGKICHLCRPGDGWAENCQNPSTGSPPLKMQWWVLTSLRSKIDINRIKCNHVFRSCSIEVIHIDRIK